MKLLDELIGTLCNLWEKFLILLYVCVLKQDVDKELTLYRSFSSFWSASAGGMVDVVTSLLRERLRSVECAQPPLDCTSLCVGSKVICTAKALGVFSRECHVTLYTPGGVTENGC